MPMPPSDPIEAWKQNPVPLRLTSEPKYNAWGQRGARAFIPRLLGIDVVPGLPYAEWWVGAHAGSPSVAVLEGQRFSLRDLILEAPDMVLGPDVALDFGPELPLLLKILAADQALSIQAHPDREAAAKGFIREDEAGIRSTARNYLDRNHKRELLVALTEFSVLLGFRDADAIEASLRATPELAPILDLLPRSGRDDIWLKRLLICFLSEREGASVLDAFVTRIETEDQAWPFLPDQPEYWLLRAARDQVPTDGTRDRGLCAFFLLNLVRLSPGNALFIEPGCPHSYLQGVGVEVMTASDNTIRGGLTPRHVDVEELVRILKFHSEPVEVHQPGPGGVYTTPAEEFELMDIQLDATAPRRRWAAGSVALFIVIEGEATLAAGGHSLELRRGDAVVVPAVLGASEVAVVGGSARLFRASVPGKTRTAGRARPKP